MQFFLNDQTIKHMNNDVRLAKADIEILIKIVTPFVRAWKHAKADIEILIKIMTPFVPAWKHALVTRNTLHSRKWSQARTQTLRESRSYQIFTPGSCAC